MNTCELPHIGVLCVVQKEGKLLLGRRKVGHGAGNWEFPGGHLECGETIEACAIRELREETGLVATGVNVETWMERVGETRGTHYILFFVSVTEFIGEPAQMEPEKNEGWEWFDKENLPTPLFSVIPKFVEKMGHALL